MPSNVTQWKSTEPWQGYQKAKEYDDRAFSNEIQKVVKNRVEPLLIQKWIEPGSNVLDIGCGTGRISIPLYDFGCQVTALDNSEGMLQVLKERAGDRQIETRLGSVFNLPFEDNTFDVVVGVTVLRHFPEWVDVAREMARVVKPGGLIIFELGNQIMIENAKELGVTPDHEKDPGNPCAYDTFLLPQEVIDSAMLAAGIRLVQYVGYDLLNSNYYIKAIDDGWFGRVHNLVGNKEAQDLFVELSVNLLTEMIDHSYNLLYCFTKE